MNIDLRAKLHYISIRKSTIVSVQNFFSRAATFFFFTYQNLSGQIFVHFLSNQFQQFARSVNIPRGPITYFISTFLSNGALKRTCMRHCSPLFVFHRRKLERAENLPAVRRWIQRDLCQLSLDSVIKKKNETQQDIWNALTSVIYKLI